jgi:folate-binding protein YgfZ
VEVRGPERLSYLNSLCTNKLDDLDPGQGARAFLLIAQKGRVLADFLACETGDALLVECFGHCADRVLELLRKYYFGQEVEFVDLGTGWRALSLQGPASDSILARAGGEVPGPGQGDHRLDAIGPVEGRVVRWTDTGETGFHVWLAEEAVAPGRAALIEAGAVPGDPDAWDALQIEAGIAAYGPELGEETIPLEAPTEDAISHTKGCYPGQEVIARLWARGRPARHLRGLRFEGERALPSGATLYAEAKRGVARVTRSALSPVLGPVALAYVHRDHAAAGTRLHGDGVEAEVAELPMVPVHA